jgi:hypothetical protein
MTHGRYDSIQSAMRALSQGLRADEREADQHWIDKIGPLAEEFDVPLDVAITIAKAGNSAAQGNRSRGGYRFKRRIIDALDQVALDAALIQDEYRVPGHPKDPLDIYIEFPNEVWVISPKRSTRERHR